MNTIVREHFPASKLPAELRQGLPTTAIMCVSATVEPYWKTMESRRAELDRVRAGMKQFRTGGEIMHDIRVFRDGSELE